MRTANVLVRRVKSLNGHFIMARKADKPSRNPFNNRAGVRALLAGKKERSVTGFPRKIDNPDKHLHSSRTEAK